MLRDPLINAERPRIFLLSHPSRPHNAQAILGRKLHGRGSQSQSQSQSQSAERKQEKGDAWYMGAEKKSCSRVVLLLAKIG